MSYTMFQFENWMFLLKEGPYIIQFLQLGETIALEKIGLFIWIEGTHIATRIIPSTLESWVSYAIFPFDNSVCLPKK
jgi:hypothetical protein